MESPEIKPEVLDSAEADINWRGSVVQIVIVVVIMGGLAIIMLALLGPTIGNVFSNIYVGI